MPKAVVGPSGRGIDLEVDGPIGELVVEDLRVGCTRESRTDDAKESPALESRTGGNVAQQFRPTPVSNRYEALKNSDDTGKSNNNIKVPLSEFIRPPKPSQKITSHKYAPKNKCQDEGCADPGCGGFPVLAEGTVLGQPKGHEGSTVHNRNQMPPRGESVMWGQPPKGPAVERTVSGQGSAKGSLTQKSSREGIGLPKPAAVKAARTMPSGEGPFQCKTGAAPSAEVMKKITELQSRRPTEVRPQQRGDDISSNQSACRR